MYSAISFSIASVLCDVGGSNQVTTAILFLLLNSFTGQAYYCWSVSICHIIYSFSIKVILQRLLKRATRDLNIVLAMLHEGTILANKAVTSSPYFPSIFEHDTIPSRQDKSQQDTRPHFSIPRFTHFVRNRYPNSAANDSKMSYI